ncbi:MaoC family dehydratase [Aureimonas sp. AU20]|uniref:MaoC family dehydratase n=1 Tax=Aureimonas sp. AU20 TaxID=1349819 RepID=UPI0007212DDA|nr:MaoC family dehydratase [Aureimonas sp. AU20]ALN72742.1 hypothetical protein M673_08455 [Aureimonas sp. AU20]
MRYFEDFTPGTQFSLGPYTVEREAVLDFARSFDPQPFHLDEDAANRSLLGGLSASGWHTTAMMMRMMCDSFLLDCASHGSPGVSEIKWLRPVRPGYVLIGEAEVLEGRLSQSRPGFGICQMRNTLREQGSGETLLLCDYAVFLQSRPADSP